jgi:hypothetical protein
MVCEIFDAGLLAESFDDGLSILELTDCLLACFRVHVAITEDPRMALVPGGLAPFQYLI